VSSASTGGGEREEANSGHLLLAWPAELCAMAWNTAGVQNDLDVCKAVVVQTGVFLREQAASWRDSRVATVGDDMASLYCIEESAIVCHLHIGGVVGVQVVAYTILDIISKVVFSFMIVSAHDSLGSSSQPQVQSREYV
jgi:hypothetical protein